MEKLPIKTKIAAWWMIVVGGAHLIILFLGKFPIGGDPLNIMFFHTIIIIAGTSLYLMDIF